MKTKALFEKISKSPIPVMLYNDEGRIILLSEGWRKLTGFSKEEIPTISDFVNKTIRESAAKESLSQRLINTGFADSLGEWSIVTKSGEERDWLLISTPIEPDREGHSLYQCMATDITQKNYEQAKIQESERKFRALYENSPLSYQSLNEDGSFREINPTWLKTLGYEIEEVQGHYFKDFLHPQWVPHFQENFPAFKKRGYVNDVQFKIRHKDGHYLDISFNGCIGYNPDGSVRQTYCVFQDVSEKKRSEELLKNQEKKYRLLFENMTQGVFYQRADGSLSDVNRAALEMFGLTRDQFLGRTSYDPAWHVIDLSGEKIPPEQHPSVVALKNGKPVNDFTLGVFRPSDNRYIWLTLNAIPEFKPGESQPYQVFVTMHDVTELKAAEEKLRQSQRLEAIGTLAGGIAHDFNNLLSGINGYTELSLSLVEEESEIHSHLLQIFSAGNRAAQLVKQILTFSRRKGLDVHPLMVQPLIKEALKLLRSSIPSTIIISEQIDHSCDMIMADPTQIHQIVMNLVTNSYHSLREKGKGEIFVSLVSESIIGANARKLSLLEGDYVCLTIKDNGSGISVDSLSKIFEPYFTTKEKGEGTGLGLSIVYGIVQNYGGTISVESQLGEGSAFYLYFPTYRQVSS